MINLARFIAQGNIQSFPQWSWGSAVLAATYRGLCEACTKTSFKQPVFTSCPLLVMLWSYERFPLGRPYMTAPVADSSLFGNSTDDRPTYGMRWCWGPPQWANVQVRSAYEYFTEAFDLLKEDNVQWCPYTDEETQRRAPNGLSTLCLRDSSYWLTKKMLVYDIAIEAYSPQRVMRLWPLPGSASPARQKRKGDASVRRNFFAKMTPWVEQWSRATLDIVNESRPYDHRTYALYMRWYTAQTRVRLVTIADADIPEMADMDMLYPMQSAPVTHLTGDIAEELYAETTSLWEKLRDNIARSREDMMSALDRMRQKCKRIMRAASCRHASDVHRPTGHRFADPLPE
uniref:Aminotransferase-like plant mobile domain-containing protein n=1 Tax=Oryza barthii TaxID=65489 RepID=A0A0D3H2W2_9ORYZ